MASGIWPLAAPVPAHGHLGWSGDTGLLGSVVEGMGWGGQWEGVQVGGEVHVLP